jgi:nitric oxide dioxygenase
MPCGTFVLKDDSKPIVLIGGGVGLTPMVSMMETLSLNKTANKVAYIHCSKGADDHAHAHNIDKIAKENDNINAHAFYSRPGESKIKELNLDDTTIHQGRLTMKDLSKIVPSPIEHNQFYMCGPEPFLQAALGMLEELKVPKNQISYEYFGPQLQ